MSEPNLRRILRYAIVWHRVFCEPRPSFVAHSAASRLLVKYPASFDALGTLFDEGWQALARVSEHSIYHVSSLTVSSRLAMLCKPLEATSRTNR